MSATDGEKRGDRGQPSGDDTGSATGDDDLARRLGELARSLEAEEGMDETLRQIVVAAVGTVPGAEDASISKVLRRREVRTLAATGELPRAVDHAQYDSGQGPCLDTLYEQDTVRLSDLNAEQRWPKFTGRARELGVGSMLSVQLFVEGGDLGALNLVSRESNAFDDTSEHIGLLFAAHAAVAMSSEQQHQDMRAAVSTREVIGQAQGILMERFRITGDMAFRLLVRASQDTNRKLRDIAEELTATGELAGT
ncbi:GAF and ANTAR domain-containing protein [Jatrophihabitans sp.]|jgi:transcriptional regulator with GAF, ATPase, and Fis domain|uniref:GAF and ANTAR domain-containing protein n=1 Tax=Jatrophihabitans sp. TaxID=1932789 RepID=UPI002F1CD923